MTFSELKSRSLENDLEPLQVTMEWTCIKPFVTFGEHVSREVELSNGRLALEDESIDIIKLHSNKYFESNPLQLLSEAKRVLKKNGRIFLCFYNRENNTLMNKLIHKFFLTKKTDLLQQEQIIASIDDLAHMIDNSGMLIDKNSIIDNGQICFELIKMDNEKILKFVEKS